MSATFRLSAKKKVSQDDLRRLMAEQKGKSAKQPKIDNPLAKYNDAGQLMCVLCKSVVRSENVWNVHVNAKQHKENVAEAKRLKELTNNFTSAVKVKNQKRHGDPPSSAPSEKKIKGILKNASAVPQIPIVPHIPKNNAPNIISYHNEEIKRAPLPNLSDAPKVDPLTNLFEKPSTSTQADEEVLQPAPEQPIPEGFFDDPILDAKVRNIEYKDPVEEEWEKFQKEIKEEATASAEIIAGEQEEATAERQIEEIDEQIRKWSRVLDIELKKEDIKKKKQDTDQMSEDEDLESDNEADLDEFLDWRAKKAYR